MAHSLHRMEGMESSDVAVRMRQREDSVPCWDSLTCTPFSEANLWWGRLNIWELLSKHWRKKSTRLDSFKVPSEPSTCFEEEVQTPPCGQKKEHACLCRCSDPSLSFKSFPFCRKERMGGMKRTHIGVVDESAGLKCTTKGVTLAWTLLFSRCQHADPSLCFTRVMHHQGDWF